MDGQADERSRLRRCAAAARRHGSLARLGQGGGSAARHAAAGRGGRPYRAEGRVAQRAPALAPSRARAASPSNNQDEDRRSGSMLSTHEAEGQQAVVADAPFSSLATRKHQMFPELTSEEIKRLR